jgi:TolB-like protein/tetratricopeptide (TPR) repeat protein
LLPPEAGRIFGFLSPERSAVAAAGRVCPSCQTPIPGDARVCPSCGAISLPDAGATLAEAVAERLRAALGHRYRIERALGEGGMAVVFLAQDLRHDRPVAVKVLKPELAAVLGAERFLREIRIAAQLNHPHILALHDSGDADGLLYYVMPYVEGDSLRRRLTRDGALPLADALGIAGEVADALAYAHDLGVIHRDIKPENILLSHGHAAVADFGIARALAGAGSALTTAGMSLGTPAYMSPEQAAGDQTLDHRTDLYSLGCTLYEMLTGRPPFAGSSAQALMAQHLAEPAPDARAARPEVPAATSAAVRRAMAKAAADRFATAAELHAALGGLPVTSGRAPAPRPRVSIRWRRALAAAVVLAVAAGVAALLLLPGHTTGAPPRPALRVVVRPFEDRTGREATAADRITEALTARLQAIPALTVVAAPVVAELRDAPLDSLRARFAPDRFVIGRVDGAGDSLRVTAEIVEPRTDKALADSAVTVPRNAAVAEVVAESLGGFVRQAFWADLEREGRRARIRDREAWNLVEQARDRARYAEEAVTLRLDRQGFQALDAADSLLALAGRRDARSDLIRIDRARIEERRGFYVEYLRQVMPALPPGLPDPADAYARALADLDRLARNRHGPADSADVLELRGRVKEGLYRERGADSLQAGAIADFRAATDVDRHRATAWVALGSAYLSAGLYRDALLAIQHASEEDVFQLARLPLLRTQFDAALGAQDFGLAGRACRAGAGEAPGDPRFRDCEIQLWSRTRGDRRSAARAQARTDSLAATGEAGTLIDAIRTLWVADILARAGLGDSADHLGRRATRDRPAAWQPLLLLQSAYLRVLRGDPDSALALIGTAARADPTNRPFIRATPDFRTLRADRRFEWVAAGKPMEP